MKSNNKNVNIKLRRHGQTYDEFEVPFEEGMNILSALQYIYENLDRTIAYPVCLCRMGKCGACAMQVNGKAQLGCAVRLAADKVYVIETIGNKEVIKDLITK